MPHGRSQGKRLKGMIAILRLKGRLTAQLDTLHRARTMISFALQGKMRLKRGAPSLKHAFVFFVSHATLLGSVKILTNRQKKRWLSNGWIT